MGLWMIQGLVVLGLYFLGAVVIGIALTPSLWMLMQVISMTGSINEYLRSLCIAMTMAGGFFVFGISLLVIVGLLNRVLNLRLKEGRYRFQDSEMFKWYFVNALVQGVKAFFMDFMLMTPFDNLFYRLMGAKLGKNVQINSKNVADLSLLEIGNDSVIGGNATVIAHIFERGVLKLNKVTIGEKVTIGLNAVIMPGVVIENGAIIPAGAIVPKGTVVATRTVYGGKKS